MEFREGDSLEGSAHTHMYNPHILPLNVLMIDLSLFMADLSVFMADLSFYMADLSVFMADFPKSIGYTAVAPQAPAKEPSANLHF